MWLYILGDWLICVILCLFIFYLLSNLPRQNVNSLRGGFFVYFAHSTFSV